MSLDLIAKLSRADLLSVAADLSDDALRTALRAVVNVSASTVAPAAVEAPAPAPVASTKAKATKKSKAEQPAAAPATPPAAGTEEAAIAFAIAELGKVGFARADLAQATGIDPDAPRLKRAIDRAVEAGTLVKAGEKRFTRYGSTKAIAEAAKK